MDAAAVLLNDSTKTKFSYAVQIPYLNIALQELQETYELNEAPVTQDVSAIIEVDAGVVTVGYSPTPPIANTPYLPDDLIEPAMLWESPRDANIWIPMTRVDVLPYYTEGSEISQLVWYVWEASQLKFLASNADNDVKLNYTKYLFATVTTSADVLGIPNAKTFLEYRTAGLCAEFIDQNITRSASLNGFAAAGIDRALGITTKGRQTIMTRRRPFRAGFKRQYYG
jgi:hypothetical protein